MLSACVLFGTYVFYVMFFKFMCWQSPSANFIRHLEDLSLFPPARHLLYFISGAGGRCSDSWYCICFSLQQNSEEHETDYNGYSRYLLHSVNM